MTVHHASHRLPVLLALCLSGGCGEPHGAGSSKAAGEPPLPPPPPAAAVAPLPDFTVIEDVPTLKRTFYEYLYPIVMAENARIRAQRERLRRVHQRHEETGELPVEDRAWVAGLAARYELSLGDGPPTAQLLDSLLRRVDVVPAPLALAQAAIESGWGRSRFARLGNNIYGQWCFSPGCGIVPGDRSAGARHEVADFDSPVVSVRSYLNNLNTHPAYTEWRILRRRQRLQEGRLDPDELATALTAYSTLREEYVRRVRDVMRQNEDLLPAAPVTPP